MTALKDIEHFLGLKRLAVVGVSREPKDFTRALWREFVQRGYDVVPVNPGAAEIDGRPCYARVQDIQPPVEGALLLSPASATAQVAADCSMAGVQAVWMYRAVGAGAVDPKAVAFCKAKGIRVIPGECPFMFLPQTPFFHRIHGFCRKLIGTYPR
jgi:predicted CoA-binding protein